MRTHASTLQYRSEQTVAHKTPNPRLVGMGYDIQLRPRRAIRALCSWTPPPFFPRLESIGEESLHGRNCAPQRCHAAGTCLLQARCEQRRRLVTKPTSPRQVVAQAASNGHANACTCMCSLFSPIPRRISMNASSLAAVHVPTPIGRRSDVASISV